jgi:hypothetical protein
LPNAHPLWQLGEGQPHLKAKKIIKLNVKINILDESYALQDEGIAKINRRLSHTMRVLHIKIKEQKHKMRVLLNSKVEICIKKK